MTGDSGMWYQYLDGADAESIVRYVELVLGSIGSLIASVEQLIVNVCDTVFEILHGYFWQ